MPTLVLECIDRWMPNEPEKTIVCVCVCVRAHVGIQEEKPDVCVCAYGY